MLHYCITHQKYYLFITKTLKLLIYFKLYQKIMPKNHLLRNTSVQNHYLLSKI
jgi:hypothetical protein